MSSSRQDEQLRSDQADGSIIAELYEHGEKSHKKGKYVPERYPTNREVASAIEKQVAVSARHTTWPATAVACMGPGAVLTQHAATARQSAGLLCSNTTGADQAHAVLQAMPTACAAVRCTLAVMCITHKPVPVHLLQASVENYRNYRHVTWYTLFIVLYMLVLYFQVRHMCIANAG
jgi:hypothetical protein